MIPDLQSIEYYVNEIYGDSISLKSKAKNSFTVEKKAIFSIIANKFYHHTKITEYSTIKRLDILYYNSDRYKLNYDYKFTKNLNDIIDKIMVFTDEKYYLSMGTL